jgi:hypothetical protein
MFEKPNRFSGIRFNPGVYPLSKWLRVFSPNKRLCLFNFRSAFIESSSIDVSPKIFFGMPKALFVIVTPPVSH